jgi:hypothetical protein
MHVYALRKKDQQALASPAVRNHEQNRLPSIADNRHEAVSQLKLQQAVHDSTNASRQRMLSNSMSPAVAQLYPKATDNKSPHGNFPLGFQSMGEYQLFLHKIHSSLPVSDATVVVQGSSITGVSYKDKGVGSREFDKGRVSDYDVALVSNTLFRNAAAAGIKIRGDHSEPLDDDALTKLGLLKARDAAQGATAEFNPSTGGVTEREVNFMVYGDIESASAHTGPALLGRYDPEDYRESTTELWGNIDFDQDRGKKGKGK